MIYNLICQNTYTIYHILITSHGLHLHVFLFSSSTGYELLCGSPVAAQGPQWHELRNSTFNFPDTVPEEISQAITAMMGVTPSQRPTAMECLKEYSFLQSSMEQELEYLKSRVAHLEENGNTNHPLFQR